MYHVFSFLLLLMIHLIVLLQMVVDMLVENDITINKVLKNKNKIAPILNNYAKTINYKGGTLKFIKEVHNRKFT